MTPAEAEAKIVDLVAEMDAVRRKDSILEADRRAIMADIDAEIRDLKKLTGPRCASGTVEIEVPRPNADMGG